MSTSTALRVETPPVHLHVAAASPWPTFWIACVAVFLVSLDTTMLFAGTGAGTASLHLNIRLIVRLA